MAKKPFHLLSNIGDYQDPSGEYFFWDESGDFLVNTRGYTHSDVSRLFEEKFIRI